MNKPFSPVGGARAFHSFLKVKQKLKKFIETDGFAQADVKSKIIKNAEDKYKKWVLSLLDANGLMLNTDVQPDVDHCDTVGAWGAF